MHSYNKTIQTKASPFSRAIREPRRFSSVLVLVAALVAVSLTISKSVASAEKGTKITGIDSGQTDFGYSPQYSKLSRVYWIKPIGADTAHILNIIPGCGCTKVPVDKKAIPPGDSARLELIFDSKRYRGSLARRPQIQIKGELFPRLIKFYAYMLSDKDIMAPINTIPRAFDIAPGSTMDELTLEIVNGADEEVLLSLIYEQPEFFSVSLPDKIAPGEKATAEVKFLPEVRKMEFENSFTFQVDYADGRKVSRHTIPVRYQVIPDSTLSDTVGVSDGSQYRN